MIEISKVKKSESEELCEKKGELFYKLMDELDLPEIYTIMTAMRGCDFSLPIHKDVFTARIRYLIFRREAWGTIRDGPKLTINEIIGLIFEAFLMNLTNRENEYLHYMEHTRDALSVLEDPIFFEEEKSEVQWLLELCINVKNIGESYYRGAIENIRELVAKYVDLDEKAYIRIILERGKNEENEVIARKETTLYEIFSPGFLTLVMKAFREYEGSLNKEGGRLPAINCKIDLTETGVYVDLSDKYSERPVLLIDVETGEEGEKEFSPST